MIKCAICVEDNACSSELEHLAGKYIGFNHLEVEVFQDAELLCRRILNDKVHFDITFIDIEMVNKNGISTTEMIRRNPAGDTNLTILVTSHTEPVMEAFDANPFHVLQKPISSVKFGEIFRAALDSTHGVTTTFDFKKHRVLYRIPIHDIDYFISASHYVQIAGPCQAVSMKAKLDEVEEHLMRINTWDFMRIHKSIIINLNHVKEFLPREVLMEHGEYLSISESYLPAYRDRMADCITLK